MSKRGKLMHDRLAQGLSEATTSIEERIADGLSAKGLFQAHLTAAELEPILSNVLFTLIEEQRFAGLSVPVKHVVNTMRVEIGNSIAAVLCEVTIHEPIAADIRFRYDLVNNDLSEPANLKLRNGLDVREQTRRFDLGAKAALAAMNVKRIALAELSDPARVILKTLPPRLAEHDFNGRLKCVALKLKDDTLHVTIKST